MGTTTRIIQIGTIKIGGGLPVALQSMAATKTADVKSTAETCQRLADAGAALVRVAVDTVNDAEALKEIRKRTSANLSVDLQENYRLAENVAPFVDKIRYNPGHLHHAEPELTWQTKVEQLVDIARKYDCALRIGVNCGSLDPSVKNKPASVIQPNEIHPGKIHPAVFSALQHSEFIDTLGFTRYCVSMKSSDPAAVIWVNQQFAAKRPDVPLHLGVTEAGLPPKGIEKSRRALEPLLIKNIGDTLRVSLTVPNERKFEEIEAGRLILRNVAAGNIIQEAEIAAEEKLNLISCPSCARVENERFVQLAEQVSRVLQPYQDKELTVAVMGCRVNGPGETDSADFGLWCGKTNVNLKKGTTLIGTFDYDDVIVRLLELVAKE